MKNEWEELVAPDFDWEAWEELEDDDKWAALMLGLEKLDEQTGDKDERY